MQLDLQAFLFHLGSHGSMHTAALHVQTRNQRNIYKIAGAQVPTKDPTNYTLFFHSTQAMGKNALFMNPRPHKHCINLRPQKTYEPMHPTNICEPTGPINSMNLRPHKLFEPKTAQIVQTSWAQHPTNFMSARPHELLWTHDPKNCINLRPQKTYEPKAPHTSLNQQGTYQKSSRKRDTKPKKIMRPTAPQTLWTKRPHNFILWTYGPMKLFWTPKTLHKLYKPKAPRILWAQGPMNFMNPRPHKLYKPKAPKNLWAQQPHKNYAH